MYCCVAKRSQQLHAWLNEPGEKDGGRAGSERSWRLCCYRAFKKSPKLDEARHPPIGSPGSFGPRNGVRGAAELARRPVDRANAADFGFYENVKGEPWHWEFCLGDTIPQRVLDIEAYLGWPGGAAA